MALPAEEKSIRPRPVKIVATLQVMQGLVFIGLGGYQIYQYGWPASAELLRAGFLMKSPAFAGLSLAISGFLAIFFAVGLLRVKQWGWLLSLSFQGLVLLWALISYGLGQPNYPVMALGVALVFYLNHQEVQAAFRGKQAI